MDDQYRQKRLNDVGRYIIMIDNKSNNEFRLAAATVYCVTHTHCDVTLVYVVDKYIPFYSCFRIFNYGCLIVS